MPPQVDQVLFECQVRSRPVIGGSEDALQVRDAGHHRIVIADHVGDQHRPKEELRPVEPQRDDEFRGDKVLHRRQLILRLSQKFQPVTAAIAMAFAT